MKVKNILLLSFIAMTVCAPNISAQGWLNKALKKVDNVTKKVDETVNKLNEDLKGNTENQQTLEGQTATLNYAGATMKCTNKNLDIQFESCIRDGELTVLSYYVTNNGNDLKLNSIGRVNVVSGQTPTSFYDNEGRQYKWTDITFGEERYNGTEWLASVILPQGIKMKCTIVLANVSQTAKQLRKATVTGWDFVLQFNDVPIYTVDQVLAEHKTVFKKETPVVESQIKTTLNEKYTIESVSITENNTQVRILLQVPQINNIRVTPTFDPNATIKADGKSYVLLNAYGVSKHWLYERYYTIKEGQSAYFDLIFEKIPEATKTLDIQFGDLFWKSVWLVDPPKPGALNIPKTRGVLSLDDAYNQHDNRKTITAAERTSLKINSIKNLNFDTKWTNSKLSIGETIYSGKEGKLQTILYIEKDQSVMEFLVSYNKLGNVVDCIDIASISAYGGDRGEGVIEGDTVIATSSFYDEDGEIQTIHVYDITPELKFIRLEK